MDTLKIPQPRESLAAYVLRVRKALKLTQFELANAAGIHLVSLGKIERGLTTKLNHKTIRGLAVGLGAPVEYLEALVKGEEIKTTQFCFKFCPQCWNPGSAVDPIWGNIKAKYCYLCGTKLRASCAKCGELVTSLRHRFCPICGHPYKNMV
jgi:DNA-binding XRE family transcriptional regulator